VPGGCLRRFGMWFLAWMRHCKFGQSLEGYTAICEIGQVSDLAIFSCPDHDQCRCDLYGWCGPLASGQTLRPTDLKT
jgi:hypothetical protein